MERSARKLLSKRRLLKVRIEELGVTLHLAYGTKLDKLYLLLPPVFCSCSSFFFNVFTRRLSERCVHLAAYEIASSSVPEVHVSFEQFKNSYYPLIIKGLLS